MADLGPVPLGLELNKKLLAKEILMTQVQSNQPRYVQYSPPSVSVWGVIGSAVGSTFGWVFKNVLPAAAAGAAGGYVAHRLINQADESEDTTTDVA